MNEIEFNQNLVAQNLEELLKIVETAFNKAGQ